MPRYVFLHNDVGTADLEGKELPDHEAAKDIALAEGRTMIQASVADTGRIDLRQYLTIGTRAAQLPT
jgi:uncharacterized protein DUF6894